MRTIKPKAGSMYVTCVMCVSEMYGFGVRQMSGDIMRRAFQVYFRINEKSVVEIHLNTWPLTGSYSKLCIACACVRLVNGIITDGW